jgi:hypothetical protein
MKTQNAIDLAGNATALAELLGITPSAISQWGPDLPSARVWQLKVIRPEWFSSGPPASTKSADSGSEQLAA